MKKKLLMLMLLVSIAISLLVGCRTSENKETTENQGSAETTSETKSEENLVTEPTELIYMFADGDEGAKAAMHEIVDRFNETYSDIVVKIEPGNGSAYNELLKTKESVGEFPDIMEMRDVPMYVRANMLSPLPDDIVAMFQSAVEFDGQAYTAPLANANTNGIIYNKKYFNDNSLEIPKTYDEFIQLCELIKEKGDMAPLVIGAQDVWHMGFWFQKAYDDQVMVQDKDFIKHCYEGTKDFSDPAIVATFEQLKEIFQFAQDGWVSTPDAQITTFLVGDMAAMMYSGTHMFSQIEVADPDFEYGWFAVPSQDGSVRLVGGPTPGGLAISSESAKDENKKIAAEEFIRFFYAPENYKIYCDKLNAIPSTVEEPDLDASEVMKEVIAATHNADSLGLMWNSLIGDNELPPDFRNFTYKTIIEVIQGQRDIESACEELNKTFQVAMQSFNPLTDTQ